MRAMAVLLRTALPCLALLCVACDDGGGSTPEDMATDAVDAVDVADTTSGIDPYASQPEDDEATASHCPASNEACESDLDCGAGEACLLGACSQAEGVDPWCMCGEGVTCGEGLSCATRSPELFVVQVCKPCGLEYAECCDPATSPFGAECVDGLVCTGGGCAAP